MVFGKLHNLVENEEALVELAENKDKALQGASQEDIQLAVEEVVSEKGYMSENEIISLINEHSSGEGGLIEEEVIALIHEHASGGGGLSEEEVIALINEHSSGEGGLSEEDVIALINEHATGGGDGLTEEEVIALINESSDMSDIREEFQKTQDRLNQLLDELDKELTDFIIGPSEPSGDAHTNPGWGIHFSTEDPVRFGQSTIRSLTSGTVHVELFEYSAGDTGDLVDSTTIELPTDGVQNVNLDIEVPESGQYLLTRDYANQPENFVSLWRLEDYSGWDDDSDERFTLHGAGHNEYSDNNNWYYFFNLHVKAL